MTINQLIKKLQKMEEKHGKRVHVCIDWRTFENEDYSHSDINEVASTVVRWSIDDNWELADGSERQRLIVELRGR